MKTSLALNILASAIAFFIWIIIGYGVLWYLTGEVNPINYHWTVKIIAVIYWLISLNKLFWNLRDDINNL